MSLDFPRVAPLSPALLDHVVQLRTPRSPTPSRLTEEARQRAARDVSAAQEGIRKQVVAEVPALREAVMRQLEEEGQGRGGISPMSFLRLVYGEGSANQRALIADWQTAGLLGERQPGEPIAPERAAAILIVRRLLADRRRGWLPQSVPPVPAWWCWRQDGPDQPWQLCPVPLPADLPAGALLWTPWTGASWSGLWTRLDEGAGRWAGQPTVADLARWAGAVNQTASELLQQLAVVRLSDG
ncbi:MAG TPA: hypothetical protein VFS21_03370 [Roseiflexaceae bacterium]|nr:hypothetical protein [Roseiflexaceae bacterium]